MEGNEDFFIYNLEQAARNLTGDMAEKLNQLECIDSAIVARMEYELGRTIDTNERFKILSLSSNILLSISLDNIKSELRDIRQTL